MGWPEISRLVLRTLGVLITARATFEIAMQLYTLAAYDFIGHQVSTAPGAHVSLMALYFLSPLAFLGLGLMLFFVAPRLVRRFSRTQSCEQTEINIRAIENVFVAVLGLYFLADGLSELARVAFTLAFHMFSPPEVSASLHAILGDLCRMAAKIVIGLGLLLRNGSVSARIHGLVGGMRRLRSWPT
jgi:hypothetical protein